MRLIPLHSLVLMAGAATEKKSQLLREKFSEHEILNCKKVAAEVYGDEYNQVNFDHFIDEVYHRAALKLGLGERVVIDAPFLQYKDRLSAISIGNKYGAPIFYIVTEHEQGSKKTELFRGDNVTNVIDTSVDEFAIVSKLPYRHLYERLSAIGYQGFCIIPDVHGMIESLKQAVDWAKARGLFMVFLGDILDYGPQSIDCVYLVYDLVMRSQAIMTIGNHERKIERWLDQQRKLMHDPHALSGKKLMSLSEANKTTVRVILSMPPKEREKFEGRFAALIAHSRNHWVIGDNLLVTHGACEPEMFDIEAFRLHGRFESRALFGEIDSKNPSRNDGYPNRIYDWVDRVPTGKLVLVGHDIRSTTKPLCTQGKSGGLVYFMDTGSGKGGRLTSADILFKSGRLDVQNFTAH